MRRRRSTPGVVDRSRALDPATATRTTARDATRLLAAVWGGTAAPAAACATWRAVMADQVTRRLDPAAPEGGTLAAKSGALFGRVRNEVGVITDPGGAAYAVAVLTRAHRPFARTADINAAMAAAARRAVDALRGAPA